MFSLGLELGLPLSGRVYSLGNNCKGPRSIARFRIAMAAATRAEGLVESPHALVLIDDPRLVP